MLGSREGSYASGHNSSVYGSPLPLASVPLGPLSTILCGVPAGKPELVPPPEPPAPPPLSQAACCLTISLPRFPLLGYHHLSQYYKFSLLLLFPVWLSDLLPSEFGFFFFSKQISTLKASWVRASPPIHHHRHHRSRLLLRLTAITNDIQVVDDGL